MSEQSEREAVAPFIGYTGAFYEIAAMLDLGADTRSPAVVWRDTMRPRLEAALRPSAAPPVDALVEALEFYADKDGWNQPPVKTVQGLISVEYENQASKIRSDRGRIARAALAQHAERVGARIGDRDA